MWHTSLLNAETAQSWVEWEGWTGGKYLRMPALPFCAEEGGEEVPRGRNKWPRLIHTSRSANSVKPTSNVFRHSIKHKSRICCPLIAKCERTAQNITHASKLRLLAGLLFRLLPSHDCNLRESNPSCSWYDRDACPDARREIGMRVLV